MYYYIIKSKINQIHNNNGYKIVKKCNTNYKFIFLKSSLIYLSN